LFPKKIETKNGLFGWCPGPGKLGQKGQNMLPIMTSPTENLTPKMKKHFFDSKLEDLLNL